MSTGASTGWCCESTSSVCAFSRRSLQAYMADTPVCPSGSRQLYMPNMPGSRFVRQCWRQVLATTLPEQLQHLYNNAVGV